MATRRSQDPIKAAARRERAQRRLGDDVACPCGEKRPAAIIPGRKPAICYGCDARRRGKPTTEAHHIAGRANSAVTLAVPINDHRAELSLDQYDWAHQTLQNPDGSPLLAMSACVRGFIDATTYLIRKMLGWIPEALEAHDAQLRDERGPQWWLNTPLDGWPPE
jgi:hypothetical protein